MESIGYRSVTTVLEVQERSLIPSGWGDSLRDITMAECAEAGRSLAHSFASDALSQYLLDGDDMAGYSDEDKWKLHVNLMTYVVAAHCYRGMVTSIGPDYDALALWCVTGRCHSEGSY